MSVGKIFHNGLPLSNVTASGVATGNITAGRTIELLQLELGGTAMTKAMISLFRLKANGKTVIEGSGTNLEKLNAYRGGYTANAAFLDIQFADYSMLSVLDKMVGAFDTTQGIANITQEITISGATAPTVKPLLLESAQQVVANGDAAPYAGILSKILQYPFNISTGGTLPITVPFGKTNGAIIKRFHVITNGGLMTGATVKQDGLVIHESITSENQYLQTKFGRVPQTNMYTIDFVLDGNVAKALDTRDSKSLEWLLTFSGADSGTVLVEYLDTLGNL
jgi:hypothetical protein